MQISKPCFFFFIFMFINLIVTDAPSAESLEDAWAVSLANDHSLKAIENDRAASRFELDAAKSERLPKLNLSSGYTLLNEEPAAYFGDNEVTTAENNFLSCQAKISLPLYTHFRITHGIAAAAAGLEALGFQQTARKQDIRLQVAESYIAVLLAQEQMDVAQSHVKSLTAIADDVQNLYDQGMVAVNDLLAAKVSLADARQKQLNARNQMDTAAAAYNRILVRPLDVPVDIEPLVFSAPEDTLAALTQKALENRSELLILSKQREALEKSAAARKAAVGPQLFLTAGTDYTENSHQVHEDLWSVGIHLSWDVFDGNIARHKSSALLKQADAARERRMDLESMIRLHVRTAWLKMEESKKRISVAEEARVQAEENLKVSRNRYQEGVGTNTDVLNAESLRIHSRVNYENAYYDFGLAIMRLKRAVGEI